MKLELKHLAPYLPYGLKFYCLDYEYGYDIASLCKIDLNEWVLDLDITKMFINENSSIEYKYIKPILRPLSDLMCHKECWEKLKEECYEIDENLDYLCEFDGDLLNTSLSYRAVSILASFHFDVSGLLKKGLAIDIKNTK